MTKFNETEKATTATTAPRQINKRKSGRRVYESPSTPPNIEPGVVYSSGQLIIAIPAGDPPVAPDGYGGTCSQPCFRVKSAWPDGQPSDSGILKWANAILAHAESENRVYTHTAIIYFARHFWQIDSPEYRHVKDLIERHFND